MAIHLFEAQRHFTLNPEAFRAGLTVPVLIWVGAPKAKAAASGDSEPTHAGPTTSRPGSGEVHVLNLVKQDARANAFAMGITVGRVPTNDVVVDDPSISRFHAYLQHDERKGGWTITDADSQNGTWVNDQKTVGHHPLPDGARVTFGQVTTWFLEPERFFEWISEGADLGKLKGSSS